MSCSITAYAPVNTANKVSAPSSAQCNEVRSGWLKSTLVRVRTFSPDVNVTYKKDEGPDDYFQATATGCGASGATRGYKTVADTAWGAGASSGKVDLYCE